LGAIMPQKLSRAGSGLPPRVSGKYEIKIALIGRRPVNRVIGALSSIVLPQGFLERRQGFHFASNDARRRAADETGHDVLNVFQLAQGAPTFVLAPPPAAGFQPDG